MRNLKIGGAIVLALFVGFFGGLYMFEKFSFDMTRDLEQRISEYRKIEEDAKSFINFSDNDYAFDYITLLQHVKNHESEDAERFLVSYLSRRYRLAMDWSTSEHEEDELYREFNAHLIQKIDELSKESELFMEIRENGRKDK